MAELKFYLSFEQFKIIYDAVRGEPEFEILFWGSDKEYMIIKYADGVSFQRCGFDEEQSGEYLYQDLDHLFLATTIDNICLKRDWKRIEIIIVNNTFRLFDKDKDELDWLCEVYGISSLSTNNDAEV